MGKLIFNAQSTPVAPVGENKHTMYVDNADGKFKVKDNNNNICQLSTETLLFNDDLLNAPDCIYCTDCFVDMNGLCANKFIVCEGVNIYITGGDYIPVIYSNDFCNMGTIHLGYSGVDKSFAEATVFGIGVLTNKTSQLNFTVSCGGKGVVSAYCSNICSGEGGKAGQSGGRGTYGSGAGYVPGTGACCAGGGGLGGCQSSPGNATPYYGGNGGYSYSCNPAGGGGFGLCGGGNGGQGEGRSVCCYYYGGNGGNGGDSVYGNGGNGGNGDLTRTASNTNCYSSCGGSGGNSVYGNGGNGGCGTYGHTGNGGSSIAGCGGNGGDICSYSTYNTYAGNGGCGGIKGGNGGNVIIDCLGNTCNCRCFIAGNGGNGLSSKYTLAILAGKYYNNFIEGKGGDGGNGGDVCWKSLSGGLGGGQALGGKGGNGGNGGNVFVYAKNVVCEGCVDIGGGLGGCGGTVCTSNCCIKRQCNGKPGVSGCYMLFNNLNICLNKYQSSGDFQPIKLFECTPSPSAGLAFGTAATNVCLRVYNCDGQNICNMTGGAYNANIHFFMPKNGWFYYNGSSAITIYPFG